MFRTFCFLVVTFFTQQVAFAETVVPDDFFKEDISTLKKVKTIHVFVALCDNEHQGIVPVPKKIGNGTDPDNNLYWGTKYGVKTFFKNSDSWTLVKEEENPSATILERIIFKHATKEVYLVADAYRGENIKDTVVDFLYAACGDPVYWEVLKVEDQVLVIKGGADLLAYVGHDGLMDFDVEPILCHGLRGGKEAIVLACVSKHFFLPHLAKLKCKGLLLTTGLMAPEAYTLEAAVEAWLSGSDSATIREEAAQAYHKYQNCGLNGARKLFYSEE